MITVQPAAELRRDFAVWAVAQTPPIGTNSPFSFAVPAALFAAVPERVLIGALIDGHRYVSPVEDEELGRTPPGGTQPETASGPDVAPVEEDDPQAPAGPETATEGAARGIDGDTDGEASEPDDETSAADPAGYGCADCPTAYATARGLAAHRRRKHPEGV
jgi:hypothetical protein